VNLDVMRMTEGVAHHRRRCDDDKATARTLGAGDGDEVRQMGHSSSICDRCGVELTVGDYPFCPHGKSTLATHPDDVPGGFTVENGFDTPRTFYSHSAHEAALAAEGYEIRAKWAGPNDQHLTRWDTVDLDSARALTFRNADAARRRNEAHAAMPIEVKDLDTFREKDLS
jgi:hypothetical protein